MSSSKEMADYIAEQFRDAGDITYRKMFGEYGFYLNGKFFSMLSDNQLFVKVTDAGRKLLENPELAPPYEGAKPIFLIEDIDNRDLLRDLAVATCDELPEPKPKKSKKKK